MDTIPQDTPQKQCSKCGQFFPATPEFFVSIKGKIHRQCRQCKKAYMEKWRSEHKEEMHQQYAKWYVEHREEKLEYKRQYRETHKAEVREYNKQYRSEHREERIQHHRRWDATHQEHVQVYRARYNTAHREENRQYSARYRQEHREESRQYSARYFAAHRRESLERSRRYNETHREERRQYARQYAKRQRSENYAVYNAKRNVFHRRRKARQQGAKGTFTAPQIAEQLRRQKYRCYYAACNHSKFPRTKINGQWKYSYHIEHTFPLSRVAGTDIPANDISYLVLSCESCNFSKHNKFPWEWADGGRLL